MLLNKRLKSLMPTSFLWRLTSLNTFVIMIAIVVSGWGIYNTACFLAAGVGNLDPARQNQFNQTLLGYLWTFLTLAIIGGSVLHYYLTKQLIQPIRQLIQTTEQLKKGHYPALVETNRQDEIGKLVTQYNELIQQLQMNEQSRKRLVTDLSHEIRTPLSNINGYLYALKEGDLKGNEALFSALHQESQRLLQLIEQLDLLKEWDHVSNQTIIKKEKTEIKKLVNQCVKMLDWTREQKNIQIDIQTDPAEVYINIEGIQQAIHNLLDNAIRYYEGKGPITLKGEKRNHNYRISILGPSAPIPQHEWENIFKRFYRLDQYTDGSGLGLAITKEIIEKHHGGKIGIESVKNGNMFWVELP